MSKASNELNCRLDISIRANTVAIARTVLRDAQQLLLQVANARTMEKDVEKERVSLKHIEDTTREGFRSFLPLKDTHSPWLDISHIAGKICITKSEHRG